MVSKNPGAIFDGSGLSLPASNEYAQLWIQTYADEVIQNTFGGAIYVAGNNIPITNARMFTIILVSIIFPQ